MTDREPADLPPPLAALVDEVLRNAGPDPGARAARADLEQHFRDGLARGRSVDELVARFGDPAVAGRLLSQSPAGTVTSARGRSQVHDLMSDVVHDVRYALRGLARTPTLVATAALVLALGIGANAVVFTVVNELLLRPIPVDDPGTLVDVWPDIPGGNSFLGISYQDFLTYREEQGVLEELVAFTGRRLDLERGGQPQVVVGQFVSDGYFEMLGLAPSAGRLRFDPEASFGDPPVAVLSHAFWTESFGADPSVVGSTVRLQGRAVTVQGIGPAGFSGHFIGFPADLWLPLTAADPLLAGWNPHDRTQKELEMIGRRRAGVSVDAVDAALNARAEAIELAYPDVNRGHRVGVTQTTGLDHSLQGAATTFVIILSGVSLLVLIIACLNVGSVLLVRAMSRDRELAVRIALGAGRLRLVRQLLVESTVLVLLGTVLGLLVAVRLNDTLADMLRVFASGVSLHLALDWRVLALTALVALFAAVFASLAPSLHLFTRNPAGVLRSRGGPSRGSASLRSGLVIGQVAVSVVLVVATGLFVRALVAGGRVDPGFPADEVASFVLQLPDATPEARRTFEREVVDALSALPSIDDVTTANGPPLGVARSPMSIDVPGVPAPVGADRHVVDARVVGAGYLTALGVTLQTGRDIATGDDEDGPRVAIVSQAFVDRFWPGEEIVGRSFVVGDAEARVVGVARDARYVVQDDTPDPLVYLSRPRSGFAASAIVVTLRSSRLPGLGDAVQRVVTERDAGHPRVVLRTSRQLLDDALLPQRAGSIIVGAMGLAALFLAGVGLYGLVQFTVARDTHALGVRLALGGGRRDLLLVVLRKGFALVGIGTALGTGVALLLAPGLRGFLSGVSPFDPVTYVAVAGTFAVVALAASWMPARRALRIEATEALRGD